MRITAVCGWAIPPEWFSGLVEQYFPQANVKTLYPALPHSRRQAESLLNDSESELYIGYSLGSLWLLTHQAYLPRNSILALIAPVLAFSRERNLGGKTPETKLKYLIRSLKRNPVDRTPLLNFYADSGLSLSESDLRGLPDLRALIQGLEFLKSAPAPEKISEKITALVGGQDIFLDGNQLKHHIPQLEIIPGAGHAPAPLLAHLAGKFHSPGPGKASADPDSCPKIIA